MTLLCIVLLIALVCFLIKKKKLDKKTIIEGIVIGFISGIIISFVTNANFQANVLGPINKLGHFFNKQVRYASKDWGDIQAIEIIKETGEKVYDVKATKIASGVVVTHTNAPLSKLPADLRYAIATGDVTENKSITNIAAPKVYPETLAPAFPFEDFEEK